MRLSIRLLVSISALATAWPAAAAEQQPAKTGAKQPSVTVVELTLEPAPQPRPALKHRLLPGYLDRVPGNAAPHYLKACLISSQVEGSGELLDNVAQWLDRPLDNLPEDEIRETLGKFSAVLHQLDLASRRARCDWDLPIRDESNVFTMLLPELAGLRDLARVVALRARLQIAEGNHDDALATLRTGFVMARHLGQQGTLVHGLVGVAIVRMMTDQLQVLVASPGAPNLYWAITALPDPVVELRGALEVEEVAANLLFPEFRDVQTKRYTPEQWKAVFDAKEIYGKLNMALGRDPANKDEKKAIQEGLQSIQEMRPWAREELIARGYSEEELDAMPASQVVVIHQWVQFDELRDDLFKWFHVPFWQGRKGIGAAETQIAAAGRNSLAALFLPAIHFALTNMALTERRLAEVRAIEAIRLYAAGHEDRLPASLDDIQQVPIPVDPFTGEPFSYRIEGDTAVLESHGDPLSQPRQYRLRLAE